MMLYLRCSVFDMLTRKSVSHGESMVRSHDATSILHAAASVVAAVAGGGVRNVTQSLLFAADAEVEEEEEEEEEEDDDEDPVVRVNRTQ